MKAKHILIGLVVAGAIAAGIYYVMPSGPKAPPGPVSPADIAPGLPGAADFNLPGGWTVYGWYTYKGKSNEKLWIRVDKGPADEGTVLTEIPWRWSIFVDRTDASGYVQIATGTKSWTDLAIGYASETYTEYADEGMAEMVVRAAADWIDTAYGGEV